MRGSSSTSCSNEAGVVCTPGAGFGRCGSHYIRISAFNSYAQVVAAMKRIEDALALANSGQGWGLGAGAEGLRAKRKGAFRISAQPSARPESRHSARRRRNL